MKILKAFFFFNVTCVTKIKCIALQGSKSKSQYDSILQ